MSEGFNSNSPNTPTPNVDSRQQVEGNRNQTIGQVYGGMVVYVGGGQAIFNPGAEESSERETDRERPSIGSNPYKGLLAFHEDDSEYYFGRSREIDDLWEKLRDIHETEGATRLLPIYGSSGSGKSSLARAGLIPELGRRPLPGRDRARVAVLFPGTKPIQALATILARIATNDLTPVAKTREFSDELMRPNGNGEYDGLQRIASVLPEIGTFSLMVLVDQFEEVYTLCEEARERDAFIANLLYAAGDRSQYVAAIVTFRSDFLGETHKHPTLSRLFTEPGYLVSAMDEEGLREAIGRPAEKAGHPLDDATIHLLIEQTEGRVGALPLLQFALTRIWEGLEKDVEPAETLKKIGGVGGALAGEAQRLYESLNIEDQMLARRLYLGLVQLGEGAEDTRRRAPLSELIAAESEATRVRIIVNRFAAPGVRFLATSSDDRHGEIVEVAHEALIRNWGELQEWLDESREALRQKRKIERAAQEWEAGGKQKGYLLQGRPLRDAREFMKGACRETALSSLAVEFVGASWRKQRGDRLRGIISTLIIPTMILTPIILHFGIVSFASRRLQQDPENCQRELGTKFLLKYILMFGYGYEVSRINLCDESLSEIDLSGNKIDLTEANLEEAYLAHANLSFSDLTDVNLQSSKLIAADLENILLIDTNMNDSILSDADLKNSKFIRTDLQRVSFTNVDLEGAIFINSDLSEVKGLSDDQISLIKICGSKLPPQIKINPDRDCSDPQVISWLSE
ncbi:MAG: pentapeptide repeat-containing protein [Cyanobacteriota bacterium]|nr:pentapeptide repeat-containing protein [Cyanobacteriota bacterium]